MELTRSGGPSSPGGKRHDDVGEPTGKKSYLRQHYIHTQDLALKEHSSQFSGTLEKSKRWVKRDLSVLRRETKFLCTLPFLVIEVKTYLCRYEKVR